MRVVIEISDDLYDDIRANAYAIKKRKTETVEAAVLSGTLMEESAEHADSKGCCYLTDDEKLIFLAAMGKERRFCGSPYMRMRGESDMLLRICSGIERKVKDTLWGG